MMSFTPSVVWNPKTAPVHPTESFHPSARPSLGELLRERQIRDRLYQEASYWDERAKARKGLSQSVWPSNGFNTLWHERQQEILTRHIGFLHGRSVLDVGCGTGRMTRFAASLGAQRVVGVDFSLEALKSAEEQTLPLPPSLRSTISYRPANLHEPADWSSLGTFDDVWLIGALTPACEDPGSLRRALTHVSHTLHDASRLVVLEPLHQSRLLRRLLALSVEGLIVEANRLGLHLTRVDRMGFVPIRLAFAPWECPTTVLEPLFRTGERLLDQVPSVGFLADYKFFVFEKGKPR